MGTGKKFKRQDHEPVIEVSLANAARRDRQRNVVKRVPAIADEMQNARGFHAHGAIGSKPEVPTRRVKSRWAR